MTGYDGRIPEPPYETPADTDIMAAHIEALEADRDALLAVVRDIDPGALMMAADELPLEAVPRSEHLRRIVNMLAALPEHLKG